MTCQISDPGVELSCKSADSGGVGCENPEPDHGDRHWISEHTLARALAGNGYACSAIDRPEEAQAMTEVTTHDASRDGFAGTVPAFLAWLKRQLVYGGVVIVCLGTLTGCGSAPPHDSPRPGDHAPTRTAVAAPAAVETEVIRVIDGDTVAVATVRGVLEPTGEDAEEHVVRILGIDAPEMSYSDAAVSECGAQEATGHLEQTLPVGMPVSVEYDLEADRTDRYGRSLAYVTTRGGTDAGLWQVADGYAMAWYPEREPEPERVPAYRLAAESALSRGLGAHGECEAIGRGRTSRT